MLLVVGAWLRVWSIGHNDLWFDEVFSRNVAVLSDVLTIARNGVAGDVHPPLYFMALSLWVRVAGESAVSLRMLSALFALLALPACYHLGRLLFNARAGQIALALAALSPFQIYYGQEARQYMLSVMLAAWAGVGLIELLRGRRYGWPLYVLAAAGGLYTHYFTALLLAALHLWLALHGPARREWRRWLSADLAIAVLFAPQLLVFARQAGAVLGGFWIDKPNPAAPITTLTFLLFSTTLPGGAVEVAAIVVVICALVLAGLDVLRGPRRSHAAWWICLGAVLLPIFAVLAFSLARSSIYLDRSFGLLSPFLLAALGGGAASARRPSLTPVLIVLLAGLMLLGALNYTARPDVRKPPFGQIAADLLAKPDSLSIPIYYLHDAAYLPMSYYAPALNGLAQVVDLGDRSWLFPQTWRIFGVERTPRADLAHTLAEKHGRFRVVVTANLEPLEQAILRVLLSRNCLIARAEYPPFVTVFEFTCL